MKKIILLIAIALSSQNTFAGGDPQILVTGEPISSCDNQGDLEAYGERSQNSSSSITARIKDLEDRYSRATGVCRFGKISCDQSKEIQERILRRLKLAETDQFSVEELLSYLVDDADNIEETILQLIVEKKAEVDRSLKKPANPQKAMDNYEARVRLAYAKHFNPLFAQARELIEERAMIDIDKSKNLSPRCLTATTAD